MGIAWLSPFVGGLLYYAFGHQPGEAARAQAAAQAHATCSWSTRSRQTAPDGGPLTPLEYAIGRLTGLPPSRATRSSLMRNGDDAYPAMLAAIDAAEHSVGLCSYIFRDDEAGEPFIEALIRAHRRGVQVRVLIDGVGGGYFWSGTYSRLREAGVPVERFLHSYVPWRMPFLNLRNHRKLMVVDGRIGFTGGINIGAREPAGHQSAASGARHAFPDRGTGRRAAHRGLRRRLAVRDRREAARRRLVSRRSSRSARRSARVVTSGPDEDLEQIEFVGPARHHLRAPLDPCGDALFPAARRC